MIELIAAAVSGAVVGGGVVWWWARERLVDWEFRAVIAADNCEMYQTSSKRILATLTALRSNCFITNEKGHRVRYSQASVERRVKAETPRADKV